jgi:hypothetical protein
MPSPLQDKEVAHASGKEKPSTLTGKVLGSGDVLLSHDLSSHYHRGCSVSLPCSEWERVVPLRYCHQSTATCLQVAGLWWRDSRFVESLHRKTLRFTILVLRFTFQGSKNSCFSLISTYREVIRNSSRRYNGLLSDSRFNVLAIHDNSSFVFLRSFDLLCLQ